MAHVLPGLYYMFAVGAILFLNDPSAARASYLPFLQDQIAKPSSAAIYGVITFFGAWLLGLMFDAIRSASEQIVDRLYGNAEWWSIFFKGDKDKVDQLTEYFYSYYVFDANLCIINGLLAVVLGIRLLMAFAAHEMLTLQSYIMPITTVVLSIIFFLDAKGLRDELMHLSLDFLQIGARSPHYRVYTRIKRSNVHGIGVFAISDIKKDTKIFYGDETASMVWVEPEEFSSASDEIKSMYHDFCVQKDGKYGCPVNFNQMPISWYLNSTTDDSSFNVACQDDYTFVARRDIKNGEELLTDYNTY